MPACWPPTASAASPPTRPARPHVAESIGLVTALSPLLGYERATAIAQEAQLTGRGAVELVLAKGLLTPEQIESVIRPAALTGLRGASD